MVLPDSLDPNIKIGIYVLGGFHLVAFLIWFFLFAKSFNQKPGAGMDKQIEKLIGKKTQ